MISSSISKFQSSLSSTENTIVHDHIALRTFDDQKVQIDALMMPLVSSGYTCKAKYTFPKTHISAQHYEHPDGSLPKVFISHLECHHFSEKFQATIETLLTQIPQNLIGQWDFFLTARPWKISFDSYETLKNENAYAAWVAAFGFRPTHFAVQTNLLEQYSELTTLNSFLKTHGFELNNTGGEIQGSPEVFLEQSSLKAAKTLVEFSDGMYPITGTYYEFAKRYSMPNGTLFNGFIPESASNLFQNTNSQAFTLDRSDAS